MARPTNRLNARAAHTTTTTGYHADGGGLYLLVGPTGSKSWMLRYQRGGRHREVGLGPAQLVSLQEARASALQDRRQLLAGDDPIEARRASRSAGTTSGEAAAAYIASHRAGWKKDAQADQWEQSLRAYGPARDTPVGIVGTQQVMACLCPIWTEKTVTATRVRGRIKRVLDWAKVQGHRDGENLARWRDHVENLLPKPSNVKKPKHHDAMGYQELACLHDHTRGAGCAHPPGAAVRNPDNSTNC